ncbi:MAG: hypothetical protein ABH814_02090, partial [bacterium]
CSLISESTSCRQSCGDVCMPWDWGGEIVWSNVTCIGMCGDGWVDHRIRVYSCDGDSNPCGEEGGGCFLADTKIATPGGEMNIQDVKVGDTVVGIDPETGERVETQVQDTHKTVVEQYYEVTVEKPDGTEEVLKVTGEHPLFVKKRSPIALLLTAIISELTQLLSL